MAIQHTPALMVKAFVNENAHYSFGIAANAIGIGSRNLIKVKTDADGRMIPEELEKEVTRCLDKGEKPFFVAATCATTLSGSYDPIGEIADICDRYDIWLHADGSLGGSVLLSDKYRHIIEGTEKADSFAWNPHKLMNIPLVCSMILMKKRGMLQRRVDAVKLWFAMKYYGIKGYQQRIDNSFEMAEYAEEKVKDHPDLELLVSRQSFTVCFRYMPVYDTDLNDFNLEVREMLRKSGSTVVNYGYIGKTLALRLVTSNGELKKSDIDSFFSNLLMAAKELDKVYGVAG